MLVTWLPTHGRMAMPRADAVRGMAQNVLGEQDEESTMREATVIRAARYDTSLAIPFPGRSMAVHSAWLVVWRGVFLDKYDGFPLWEEAVYNALVPHYEVTTCPWMRSQFGPCVHTG